MSLVCTDAIVTSFDTTPLSSLPSDMKLLHVVLVVCVLGFTAGQTYNQGVVQGATLALAGTAVVGLGVLAIQVSYWRAARDAAVSY